MSEHFSARAIESMPRESNGWATRSWYLSSDADRRRGRHAGSMIPKPSIPVISPAESSFRSGPARMGQENCDRDERMAAQHGYGHVTLPTNGPAAQLAPVIHAPAHGRANRSNAAGAPSEA